MTLTKKNPYNLRFNKDTFLEDVIRSDGNVLCIFIQLSGNNFKDSSCLNHFLEQRVGIDKWIKYAMRIKQEFLAGLVKTFKCHFILIPSSI